MQRRLTYTRGVEGARHWVRSSPDGSRIAFLMKDERGVVQIWTVGPNGGEPVQVTGDEWDVASAFSWRRDGGAMAYVMDGSVFSVDARRGKSRRVTEKRGEDGPLGLACAYSPDGGRIAYLRRVGGWNQVFVAEPEWA
jgi:Tol biopolymer transport system component